MEKPHSYMNPYLAGFLLGLVLLAAVFITGRGLGASGALKSVVAVSVKAIAPSHFNNSVSYKEFKESNPQGMMKTWLVLEVLGVIIGAVFSGIISDRFEFKLEKSPKISNKKRLIAAIIGGALFGLGSQFGRGCTSGAALSGMAVLSLGGIITMMAIFGTGYVLAYFFRKLWI